MATIFSHHGPADRPLLISLLILITGGLLALMSASAPVGYAQFHDSYFFLKHQIFFGLLPGLAVFLVAAKIPSAFWAKSAWVLYGVTLFFLALVFIPGIGITINGSQSWLRVFNFTIQPSEFAKVSIIIFLAYILTNRPKNWTDWQASFLPIIATVAPAVLLILAQHDLGTVSIISVIIFIMMYVGRVPGLYLALLGLAGVILFAFLIMMAPYRVARFTTFLHPELDPKGVGYQVNQSFLAIGSGGFWGLGFGHSRQKFQYLPEVSADSIYAVIAEENGFLISTGLVVLILLIGWRGLRIAKRAPSPFAQLAVTGIVVWILWQSFLNIGAAVGVLPLTGVPLPLVSHGGSAFVAALVGLGIIIGVSKEIKMN
ncbi:MAG: putative lipid II flippase FtsW [Candidatus Magasanikbacteria bacterium]|nr:putative lipid II flippase FtsW [Candidatus Magasanikbacteria bacterium]